MKKLLEILGIAALIKKLRGRKQPPPSDPK